MKKMPIMVLLICVCISCQRKKGAEGQNIEEFGHLKDSISGNFQPFRQPDASILGFWNSEMLCSKADCGLYVIGDRRNEIWEFMEDSAKVYAHALHGKKLLTVFRAVYNGDQIVLESCRDSLSENTLKINILLDDLKDNVIKGTQKITIEDNCISVFDVELTRAEKGI
ncbi:hypothetical protein [Flavobacterium phragmitis]|uniref:Lipocalin-like domain-containing protein n=1 Tax=Flavobacterium phragmitis TaxID=739143 RepID=A0A1I1LZ13_9FLAO|nr:hypothetical protein [Flavobacterium phragmitis]SFC75573.1 hypothetical protein SAMN05216297_102163 [Flavobacterium phragmitis]